MDIVESNLLSTGKRMKKARLMAGIRTRKEFFFKSNISVNTLQGWEQDKNKLTRKGANRVVEALWKEKVMCTAEWLLYGRGMPPRIMESHYLDEVLNQENLDELNLDFLVDQESKIAQEKTLFSKINPHSVIFRINDDAMSPLYEYNTLVGGVYCPVDKANQFLGQSCIVEFELDNAKMLCVRNLCEGKTAGTFTLYGINPSSKQAVKNFYDIELTAFAPILWSRKALKI